MCKSPVFGLGNYMNGGVWFLVFGFFSDNKNKGEQRSDTSKFVIVVDQEFGFGNDIFEICI